MPPDANDIKIPNNSEIDQALKEFEEKSKTLPVEVPKLSDTPEIPKMVRLAMKLFHIKEQKQAEYILFSFVLVIIGISLFFFLS